ncbi:MAG: ferredoxin family protein [Alistipes sp.]|nr:ferredoxin family protein [Alistipes sp.]MDE6858298.1 ferredoxin family protein [Alistipes sp.]
MKKRLFAKIGMMFGLCRDEKTTAGRPTKKRPRFTSRGCTACWACVEACPRKAVGKIDFAWHRHAVLHRAACIGCMKCVRTCPNGCFKAE